MNNKKLQERSTGFSLVELLVTLLLVSILVSWATADTSEVRQRALINETAQNLNDAIQYGQEYARHLSVPSALCAGTPDDQCQSNDWTKGWTLFQADAQDASKPLQAIRVFEQNSTGVNLQIAQAKNAMKIVINGEGFIDTDGDKPAIAIVCSPKQDYHVILTIDKASRTTTTDFTPTNQSEDCKDAA